jgi:hypothetical protein
MKAKTPVVAYWLILLFAAWMPAAESAPVTTAKTVRLLTVGNSFSQNATHYLPSLATASGHALIHRPIAVGGASLQFHAEKAQKHAQDADDSAGLYANKRSLQQELAAEPWDFVTIQQASLKSDDLSTYRPYAGQLRDYVAKHAPGAQLLVHATWAYRCDDPRFTAKPSKSGGLATQQAMYRGLAHAYEVIAMELGVRLIPVADAFYQADCKPHWGYRIDATFDFLNAQPPTLPDQTHSLHVGWRWTQQKAGPPKLSMDGHHANTAGEYLGACVFYEVLFGESVVGNTFVAPGLAQDYARFLRETAHKAVTNDVLPRATGPKSRNPDDQIPVLKP